jgi:asparagine synthase (glutamine-hydrolysing)
VGQLVAKLHQGSPLSETDDMALAGIISTQLVHQQFVSGFRASPPLDDTDDVKLVEQKTAVGDPR